MESYSRKWGIAVSRECLGTHFNRATGTFLLSSPQQTKVIVQGEVFLKVHMTQTLHSSQSPSSMFNLFGFLLSTEGKTECIGKQSGFRLKILWPFHFGFAVQEFMLS